MECWRNYLRACINLENALMEAGMLSRYIRNLTKLVPALGLIAAAASPLVVIEYQLPRSGAFPHDPAVGGDGIVWYTDQQNSFIGRLDSWGVSIQRLDTSRNILCRRPRAIRTHRSFARESSGSRSNRATYTAGSTRGHGMQRSGPCRRAGRSP